MLTKTLLTALMLVPMLTKLEKAAAQYEYEPEVYMGGGEINGCGLTFRAAWLNDAKQPLGVVGSLNYFATDSNELIAMFKIKAADQRQITYAWVAHAEGDTKARSNAESLWLRKGKRQGPFAKDQMRGL